MLPHEEGVGAPSLSSKPVP